MPRLFSLEKMLPTLSQRQKGLFFFLTLFLGCFFFFPHLDYQAFLSTGDHGRELYGFKCVMDGGVPYRDFSWFQGPLTPYYYALFFKLFGPTIQSAVLGQTLLVLLTGLVIFFLAASFLTPGIACLCAASFWVFRGEGFFYTYSHDGGLLAFFLSIFFLFKYFDRPLLRHALGGFLSLAALLLIRLNLGIVTLIPFVSFLFLRDMETGGHHGRTNVRTYAVLALLLLGSVAGIYWSCIRTLPLYTLPQNFPFLSSFRADAGTSLMENIRQPFLALYFFVVSGWPQRCLAIFLIATLIQTFRNLRRKECLPGRRILVLKLSSLLVFTLFSMHEFILSGIFYRVLWFFFPFMLLLYAVFDLGTRFFWRPLRILLMAGAGIFIFLNMSAENIAITATKKDGQLFELKGQKIFTLQPPEWIDVVEKTVAYIDAHLGPQDSFFALPYDPLYYFLTDRRSPSRELILFQHFNVPPQQEAEIIRALETKNVTYVLISNRAFYSTEPGMGVFGKDYCPGLADYVRKHYQPVAEIGTFKQPAVWAFGHAVRIFKRNP